MQRTGVRQYVARNQDGAEIRIGHGPGLFSPGDLLKLALAGCNAMSSDARMAARLGDDFEQFVGVSGDYDQQNDRFTHVDVELVQDMSACPTRRSRTCCAVPKPRSSAIARSSTRSSTRRCRPRTRGRTSGSTDVSAVDRQYEDLLARIMREGTPKGDRTGTGTRSIFGAQLRYDLSKGFPLITTKRVHLKSVVGELLWFLSGSSNVSWLQEHGIRIWNEWADQNGELGPVYGVQWRSWNAGDGRHIDQISQVLETLKTNPDSRRMVVSAWNVGDLPQMALEPCHAFFQLYVSGGRLSLQLYQRSADMFLGVPFNIASYSLLTHMFAQQAGLEVGDFIWTGGDCHIYSNHTEQVTEQLSREPYPFPRLELGHAPSMFEYSFDDISVTDYQHHPTIKAPVAV